VTVDDEPTRDDDEAMGTRLVSLPAAMVVEVWGEVDLNTAFGITTSVVGAGMDAGPRPVVVDLREVTYLDSSGVRALTQAARTLRQELVVLAPSPVVQRVFRLVEADSFLRIIGDLTDLDGSAN
jgi:anti-sigma B factor antagonist